MKHYILLFFILINFKSFSQTDITKVNFNYKISEVLGDLNKDKLLDKVIVSKDTLNENAPYKLEVFFQDLKGQFKLFIISTKIILPDYPIGRDGYRNNITLSEVIINKGILNINFELIRGHFEYKFRFQNENFELIGFTEVISDGQGIIETIDFNLSTGIRIVKLERYDIDKKISNTKKKIVIKPLPKLQDVIPLENELY